MALDFIDGNWVDIGSILGAGIYACWHRTKIKSAKPFISKVTGIDFINGLSLWPLLMLVLGIFSSKVLEAVLSSNRLILAAAGAASAQCLCCRC